MPTRGPAKARSAQILIFGATKPLAAKQNAMITGTKPECNADAAIQLPGQTSKSAASPRCLPVRSAKRVTHLMTTKAHNHGMVVSRLTTGSTSQPVSSAMRAGR